MVSVCLPSDALSQHLPSHLYWKRWAGRSTTGIKIAGRNINNHRYADDTTLMAESEEELKSLSMKGKEESEKVVLKLNIQKMKIVASGPITSWEMMGKQWKQCQTLFWGGSKITANGDCSHEIKRCLLLERKVYDQPNSIQFSCSVMSNSLRPHEQQRASPPCPSPTPRVQSDSRPSNR